MNLDRPVIRRDLDFFPVNHGGQQLILLGDHLGLVQEGKAVSPALYQLMALLDGTHTINDLQTALMRQRGGVSIGREEIEQILDHLDSSFLLDSERFRGARDRIFREFQSMTVRPCSHGGRVYPEDPVELRERLDVILHSQPQPDRQREKIIALASPHIDLSVGTRVYARAYQTLMGREPPSRVVLLGIGHKMTDGLFCLTDKDFQTPLGLVKNGINEVKRLRKAGQGIVTAHDFPHKAEHSLEFQLIFLQHLFHGTPFTLIPILCGSLMGGLPQYTRHAYRERAGEFLEALRDILSESAASTLVVAGIDLSHTGPKFGHGMPASHLKNEATGHDQRLLEYFSRLEPEPFWEESADVKDQFNVCGFSAMACMMEVLPSSRGRILGYERWDEEATRSAVSFAAAVFTSI